MSAALFRQQASQFAQQLYDAISSAMEEDSSPADLLTKMNGVTAEFFKSVDEVVINKSTVAIGELQKITKFDEELRMIWGWASVSTVAGEPVVDLQGDIIETGELQKAAHEYVAESRRGDELHRTKGTGMIVDSLVFTKEIQKALGIDLGMEGWFIGYKVGKDEPWEKVKSGEYRAFSIGGSGEREPVASA